jgi:Protein of unknown function DUF262/HNH endonuclease
MMKQSSPRPSMEVDEKKYKISTLVETFIGGSLLRNPEYQRGETWNEIQKATFVDSIFRNYPVPALFFYRVETTGLDNETSKKYEIVDGQQRLTALRDYCASDFSLLTVDSNSKLRLPKSVQDIPAPWAGKRYRDLDAELQSAFKNNQVTVFIVGSEAHRDEVRDLFIRLQSGTALTRQQIRDAWPGNLGPFIEGLAGKLTKRPSHKLFSILDKRGQRNDEEQKDNYVFDRQLCAQLLKVFLARAFEPYAFPSLSANELDSMYHQYTDFDEKGELAQKYKDILTATADVFEKVKSKGVKKAKFTRLEINCVMMFLQDASKNNDFQISRTVEPLATNIVNSKSLEDSESTKKPRGKSTSGSTLKDYYLWWRDNVAKEVGVRLDQKRLFDDSDKYTIRTEDRELCQICKKQVFDDAEDYAEYDHYPIPYRDGGPTIPSNGRLVHRSCHPRGRVANDE